MSFGNFLIDNLANIWNNNSMHNRFFGNNNLPNAGVNLNTLSVVDSASNLSQQGWNISDVTISDRAKSLADTDKAMADVVQKEMSHNTDYVASDKTFRPRNEHPMEKYYPKPTPLPFWGQSFNLKTGAKIFEFTGSFQSVLNHAQSLGKGSLSILNTAKNSAMDKTDTENAETEATGTYAVFESLEYNYSYNVNSATRETEEMNFKRASQGNYIAKKLEIKDNVIDLRNVDYAYSDVKNSATNQPYRTTRLDNLDIHDITRRLLDARDVNSGGRRVSPERYGEAESEERVKYLQEHFTGKDLRRAGMQTGEFTLINKNGEKQVYVLTSDNFVFKKEDFDYMEEIYGEGGFDKLPTSWDKKVLFIELSNSQSEEESKNLIKRYVASSSGINTITGEKMTAEQVNKIREETSMLNGLYSSPQYSDKINENVINIKDL